MTALEHQFGGLLLAGLGHRSDATERPLISVLQSSPREGPLPISEPPLIAAVRSAVDDPLLPSGCREADVHEDRSAAGKQPFVSTHSWDDYACRRKVIAAAA